MFKDYISGKLQ